MGLGLLFKLKYHLQDGIGTDLDRFQLCWAHVLPYLALQDILAVSQTNKRLETVVSQFYKSEQRLILDKEMAHAFPIASNSDLYDRLGKDVTAITLSAIDQDQLELAFKSFPNITSLTLDNL